MGEGWMQPALPVMLHGGMMWNDDLPCHASMWAWPGARPALFNVLYSSHPLGAPMTLVDKPSLSHVQVLSIYFIRPGHGQLYVALLEHSFWSREQDVERGVGVFVDRCSHTILTCPHAGPGY